MTGIEGSHEVDPDGALPLIDVDIRDRADGAIDAGGVDQDIDLPMRVEGCFDQLLNSAPRGNIGHRGGAIDPERPAAGGHTVEFCLRSRSDH